MLYLVVGLLAIAAATLFAGRLGVAAPLLLVLLGIGVSVLPWAPDVEIEPEWVLAGVLPPLLYSASAALPAMDFRREFGTIRGLSVVLVVDSSLVLGVFLAWALDVDLAWGIALGAIVSPTDAVATSIVKRLGVSRRAVTMLEGESLLNDATALVLLRAAIAARPPRCRCGASPAGSPTRWRSRWSSAPSSAGWRCWPAPGSATPR